MKIEIKIVDDSDILEAMELIEICFDKFVAPDYSEQGIKTFKENFINNPKFMDKFRDGREKMFGAYNKNVLTGCISISKHNTISCLFVKEEFHRKGIGRLLFERIIEEVKESNQKEIKLNASPYGVPFYHAIGFENTGEESDYEGIIYTPMRYIVK